MRANTGYGPFTNEELLGEALAPLRPRLTCEFAIVAAGGGTPFYELR